MEIIDLTQNEVPVVVHLAALVIDLGANHVSLIVHLVATIAGVILVETTIDALVATIALVSTDQRRIASAIVG